VSDYLGRLASRAVSPPAVSPRVAGRFEPLVPRAGGGLELEDAPGGEPATTAAPAAPADERRSAPPQIATPPAPATRRGETRPAEPVAVQAAVATDDGAPRPPLEVVVRSVGPLERPRAIEPSPLHADDADETDDEPLHARDIASPPAAAPQRPSGDDNRPNDEPRLSIERLTRLEIATAIGMPARAAAGPVESGGERLRPGAAPPLERVDVPPRAFEVAPVQVDISIGRIEIAATAPSLPSPVTPTRPQATSLELILERRRGDRW
jgi:hypothetical protein